MTAHTLQLNRTGRRWPILLAAAAGLGITGCDFLLDVPTVVVTPDATASAGGAEALRLGALNRFGETLGGAGAVGLIPLSGSLGDEFIVVATGRPGMESIDRRIIDEINEETYVTAQFQRLSQTRLFTRLAIEGLQQYAPHRQSAIAQMFAFRAFAEILLAEHFCAGIPLSEVEEGRAVFGEPLTNEQVYTRALQSADSALARASESAQMANLARVARARALLNLERFSDAAAAVSAVPDDFVYNLEFADGAKPNGLTTWVNQSSFFRIGDEKGTNGLSYVSDNDPRLAVVPAGTDPDGTQLWVPANFASRSAPIVLASGIEARLIEAEARLWAGDGPGALAILNALRATREGLDPLSDAGSTTARQDQLFRERAFWLFGTAQRLGDMRRLVRQYDRDQALVFPVGEYHRGGVYGSEVTFSIPLSEQNNPLAAGCLSRGA